MTKQQLAALPEKLAEFSQGIVMLVAMIGFGYTLYHFFSFQIEQHGQIPFDWLQISFISVGFLVAWTLAGGLLGFLAKTAGLSFGAFLSVFLGFFVKPLK